MTEDSLASHIQQAGQTTPSNSMESALATAGGKLLLQPRMGMKDVDEMGRGLRATQRLLGTVGTITVDSYTRLRQYKEVREALRGTQLLNGYPLTEHPPESTRSMLDSVQVNGDFCVQLRHGSPDPRDLLCAAAKAGLCVTEGGPLSYCLPYGRTALSNSVAHWSEGIDSLLAVFPEAHLETFGGCLLGQLCPPSLLVAVSILEALYFAQRGVTSVSLSYAQQVSLAQDARAVRALQLLAHEYLSASVKKHVVLYTFMGLYPRTPRGADAILRDAVRLAIHCGIPRLIVKTDAEAHRIPSVEDNVRAMERARRHEREFLEAGASDDRFRRHDVSDSYQQVFAEAKTIVDRVLNEDGDIGSALLKSVRRGYIDIPFCLHPDNKQQTAAHIDENGWLRWTRTGLMPVVATEPPAHRLPSERLQRDLRYVATHYDQLPVTG